MNNTIFSIYYKASNRLSWGVLSQDLDMNHAWSVYDQYPYISNAHTKVTKIPRHLWSDTKAGSIEKLLRAKRTVFFSDQTRLVPLPNRDCPVSHTAIQLIKNLDHVSYWVGPNREAFTLVELLHGRAAAEHEIAALNLTGLVIPNNLGPYGVSPIGASILFTDPKNIKLLETIEERLQMINPIETAESPPIDSYPLDTVVTKSKTKGDKQHA